MSHRLKLLALVLFAFCASAVAADPTGLLLPPYPVTASHQTGSDSYFDVVLSGVGAGFDVADGVYDGWCVEDNHQANTSGVILLSSYDMNLPADLLTCQSGPCAGLPVPWDKLNYLLNHKLGNREDIEAAIWLLMWNDSQSFVPTALSLQMVAEANANGAGFVPAVGQVVAVILYTQDGTGIGLGGFQDTVIEVPRPEVPLDGSGCRMTGGGNDSAGLAADGSWDGTFAYDKPRSRRELATGNEYTFGGQAGANTGAQPQPKGEWTHHNVKGVDGSFVFHAGTASSPAETEIDLIECSDPGWCVEARPAPDKQIDFQGVGQFKNIKSASPALAGVVAGETFHWFTVHVEDLGEPGKAGQFKTPDPNMCPANGSAGVLASCGCPDYYHITIYTAFDPATQAPDTATVIYEAKGYIDGGNLQIHPPTGFDLK